jgi:hypothetical protein
MLNDSDSRQLMIIMQNALGHATKLSIHNSKGEVVEVDEVIKLAKRIASEVVRVSNKVKEMK